MAFGLLSAYSRFYRYIRPNTIIRKTSDTSVVFLNVAPDIREAHIDQETEAQAAEGIQVPTYTVYGNTLNFAREDYITGINVIGQGDDKLLFWTDNRIVYRNEECSDEDSPETTCAQINGILYQFRVGGNPEGDFCDTRSDNCELVQAETIERTNEPRKINIERFKAASHIRTHDGRTYAETNFTRNINTQDPKFFEQEVSVIKPHPLGSIPIPGSTLNEREFQLRFNWIDIEDYEYLTCRTDAPANTCKSGEQFTIDGESPEGVDQTACGTEETAGCYCNPDLEGVTNCYKVIVEDGEENFNDADRIFSDAFPRFSYRWRYTDGEYSPMAPFTAPAFVPASYFVNEIQRYSEGVNERMTNSILGLTIENISRGPTDVEAIDLLYKESLTNTVYSIETIEIPPERRGFGFETYNVNKRSFYRSIPSNQLFRVFDEVPRAAKSQEISGNRLIFGNYLKNYEQPKEVNMVVVSQDRPNLIREGEDEVSDRADQRTVKGDRKYEIGLVYIDKFGRQGALLTGPLAEYETPFYSQFPQQLSVVVQDDAPEWAVYYRYYVKDVSAEHFNVFSHAQWRDPIEPEFTWLQISSNDRNKIIEDGALYVKGFWRDLRSKANEHIHERSGDFTAIQTKYRRQILDIQDNVPTVLRTKLEDAWNVNPLFGGTSTEGLAVLYERCSEYSDTCSGWNGVADSDTGYVINSQGQRQPITDSENPNYEGGGWDTSGWLPNKLGFYPDHRGNYPDEYGRYPQYAITSTDLTGEKPQYPDSNGEYQFNNLGNFADGSFFVKVPTGPVAPVAGINGNTHQGDVELYEGWFGGDQALTRDFSYWFETEPQQDDSLLGLYYESGETFSVENDHRRINRLDWSNAIQFEGNIEERKLEGRFNSPEIGPSPRVNVPQENYELDRVFNGLIFSGLFNDANGNSINRLNEFIITDGITKEIEPNYGSIQKLYTRDTNLIVFLEDKIFRILTDKDALYNADGNSNVTSTRSVLGQATAYQGEYGISRNPESFCFYGGNIWFTDRNRGVVLQLTPANGQLFEISGTGLTDFWRDRLRTAERVIGSFDDYHDQVTMSIQGYDVTDVEDGSSEAIANDDGNQTLVYETSTQGWVSRRSFIPDAMTTLNNRFYSFSGGLLYMHNVSIDSTGKHLFYGQPYSSTVNVIMNDLPGSVKEFKTINYEGSSDWDLTSVDYGLGDGTTDVNLQIFPFVSREGKFFTPIVTKEEQFGACNPADEQTQIGGLVNPVSGSENYRITVSGLGPDYEFIENGLYYVNASDIEGIVSFSGQDVIEKDPDNMLDHHFEIPHDKVYINNVPIVDPDVTNIEGVVNYTNCLSQEFMPYKSLGEYDVAGVKGFWVRVIFTAPATEDNPQQDNLKELFSIGSEVFISTK